jgi:hypothetical protein
MGIFADVTLSGGMTICKVYISPRYISANRDVGHYALDYLSKKGGEALPIPPDYSIIEFKAEGREQPGDNPLRRSGVVYDRDKPAHGQVYADLREKLKAGQVPWLGNVRNEDGSSFVDVVAAPAPAPAPEPTPEPAPASEPEHAFADLMLADETIDDAKARLSQRLKELRHYLIAPEIKVNEDGSVGLTGEEQSELQDLERRQTLGRWLDA